MEETTDRLKQQNTTYLCIHVADRTYIFLLIRFNSKKNVLVNQFREERIPHTNQNSAGVKEKKKKKLCCTQFNLHRVKRRLLCNQEDQIVVLCIYILESISLSLENTPVSACFYYSILPL